MKKNFCRTFGVCWIPWVSCHDGSCGSCAIVGPKFFSCVFHGSKKNFSWVLRGFESFFSGYFMGPKFFLMGISWIGKFFMWVLRGSESFSRGYLVGPKFFLVGISCVQNSLVVGTLWVPNFFSWVQSFFRGYFVGVVRL